MSETPLLGLHLAERGAILRHFVPALRTDRRVVAAWLAGSIGRGTADALSDLDLWIVLRDQAMPAVRERPRDFVTAIRAPLLVIEQPPNAPPGGAYLFTLFAGDAGPHQVDWYWLRASTATRPRATRLLFDHTGIPIAPPSLMLTGAQARERLTSLLYNAVAMVAIAAKSVVRGWTLRAAGNLLAIYQLLTEIEWILDHNTSPEYDDIKERVRDIPVPASAAAALDDLTRLLVHAESLRGRLGERGVSWPSESLVQVRSFLLNLNQP